MRKPVIIAALVALGFSALLSGASAHTVNYPTGLVFDPVATGPSTVQYRGRMFGAKFCREKRLVDIYVDGALFTTVLTKSDGTFSVGGARPSAGSEATAIARKKVRRSKGHKHKCPANLETKKAQ